MSAVTRGAPTVTQFIAALVSLALWAPLCAYFWNSDRFLAGMFFAFALDPLMRWVVDAVWSATKADPGRARAPLTGRGK